jgi:hypothetical protein
MVDQARAIGRRVRYWRVRRNLDRQRFADMVGRSTSWVDKIEKGERSLLRLPIDRPRSRGARRGSFGSDGGFGSAPGGAMC